MAKTFLFFRGPKTERRIRLTQELRRELPRTVWIAMDQIDEDPKRAHAACVATTKTALLSTEVDMIAIDNESMKPIHWQAYYAIAERKSIAVTVVGIDLLDDTNPEQLNLQLENSAMFIASVDKYWCVKTDLDASEVETWFKAMKGTET